MSRGLSGFSPRYFTPTFKPRFKPRVGGRISPFGLTKPKIKPRIMPTALSGVKPRMVKPRMASTTNLLKQTHRGVTASTTPRSQRAAAPTRPGTVRSYQSANQMKRPTYKPITITSSRTGLVRVPKTIAPKMPGIPHVSFPHL